MEIYVRSRFRDQMRVQDPRVVQRLLAEGQDELAQMEYYHSVYQAKQQASQGAAPRCSHCLALYEPPHARFCGNCGTKRPA